MDGWVGMNSDDAFPIRQAIPVWASVLVLGSLDSVFCRRNYALK